MDLPSADTGDDQEDGELLRRYVQHRNRGALDRVLTRHLDTAFRVAKRITGAASNAEDAVQEAFVHIITHAGDYVPTGTVRAWLLAIVANTARNYRRDTVRRWRRERSEAPAEPVAPSGSSDDRLEMIASQLAELPEHERVPISLRFIDGLSFAEVASVLGVPMGTVQSQVHRGLDRLRARLVRVGVAVAAPAVLLGLAGSADAAPAALRAAIPTFSAGAAAPTAASIGSAGAGSGTIVAIAAAALGVIGIGLGIGIATSTGRHEPAPAPPAPPAPAIAKVAPPPAEVLRPVDDLEGALAWTQRYPGAKLGIDVIHDPVHGGHSALQLAYRPQERDRDRYGEVSRPLRLLPDDRALRFYLLAEAGEAGANWTIQFRQRDGTCWMIGGGMYEDLRPGWNRIDIELPRHPKLVSEPAGAYDPANVDTLMLAICVKPAVLVIDDVALVTSGVVGAPDALPR